MKLISWNVNGIRACLTKGFADFFKEVDADIFCLQETKCQPDQVDLEFEGYKSYWNSAEKKGYSGTAIFTKQEPINVTYGIGIEEHDKEGRVITLEFEKFYMILDFLSLFLYELHLSPHILLQVLFHLILINIFLFHLPKPFYSLVFQVPF